MKETTKIEECFFFQVSRGCVGGAGQGQGVGATKLFVAFEEEFPATLPFPKSSSQE
jgi:hypothetical protein